MLTDFYILFSRIFSLVGQFCRDSAEICGKGEKELLKRPGMLLKWSNINVDQKWCSDLLLGIPKMNVTTPRIRHGPIDLDRG